jgi:type II secretory pathway component PulM
MPEAQPMNRQPDIDKDAIHDNIQRTAERVALRKVNKLSEELKYEQLSRKRIEKIALIAFVAIFVLVGLWVVFGDKSSRRVNEIEIPGNITQPKKY